MGEGAGAAVCECGVETCGCRLDVFGDAREAVVRYLLEEKGYRPEEVRCLVPLVVEVPGKRLRTRIDVVVELEGRPALCLRFHEGSVVSRERGTIAAARVLSPEAVPPVCVQTNGEEHSVLDAVTGKSLGHRLEDIPSREELLARLRLPPRSLSPRQVEGERKILFFYDGIG